MFLYRYAIFLGEIDSSVLVRQWYVESAGQF